MKNHAPLVCACLLGLCPLQGDVYQDLDSTLITQTIEVGQPLAPCEAADVVGFIARIMGVPAGIEFVPGDCGYRHVARSATRQSLQGLSIREALNQIVQWDPRYEWKLLQGVVSFRPVAATNRPDHFLHTTTGDLDLVDDDMAGALAAITGPARYCRFRQTTCADTARGEALFSVAVERQRGGGARRDSAGTWCDVVGGALLQTGSVPSIRDREPPDV